MLIFTAKLPRRKPAIAAAAAAFLCCAALSVLLHPPAAVSVSSLPSPKGVRSNEDRVGYLQQYGWQVSAQPIAVEQLQIPAQFSDSYADYLALQSRQGFDLTGYAGKRVTRYTYQLLNHPRQDVPVWANLLLYRSTVVGGEVLSSQGEGFLHGLSGP